MFAIVGNIESSAGLQHSMDFAQEAQFFIKWDLVKNEAKGRQARRRPIGNRICREKLVREFSLNACTACLGPGDLDSMPVRIDAEIARSRVSLRQ